MNHLFTTWYGNPDRQPELLTALLRNLDAFDSVHILAHIEQPSDGYKLATFTAAVPWNKPFNVSTTHDRPVFGALLNWAHCWSDLQQSEVAIAFANSDISFLREDLVRFEIPERHLACLTRCEPDGDGWRHRCVSYSHDAWVAKMAS